TQAFADTALTHASVTGNGGAGAAILIVNDTYLTNQNAIRETVETISLGSLNDAGVGSMVKYDAGGNPINFLTLSNFPNSYAYAGRADGTVALYGSTSAS